jgi:hypothetical protein
VLNTGADTLGAGSGFALTFDAGATDPVVTFGSDSVAWTGAAAFTVGGAQVLTSESDPNALLTAGTDNVKDTHIDWGAGAGQVDADDISDGSTNAIITLTQETNFGTAYSHSQDNTQAHSDYVLNTGADTLGTGSGFALTFDAGATDPVFTFGSDSVAITGATTFTVGGAQVQTGTDDDVPDAGDFGSATDLDANGALSNGAVDNAAVAAAAEIAVSKMADGTAYQVIQTASNGTDVEWTGTLNFAYISDEIPIADNGDTTKTLEWELSGLSTATAKTITVDDDGYDHGTMDLITTGIVQGHYNVTNKATGATLSDSEMDGWVFVTAAATITLPAVEIGQWVCVHSTTAALVSVNPNDNDRIRHSGTADSDGHQIDSNSAAGDKICLVGDSADGWTTYNPEGPWTAGS